MVNVFPSLKYVPSWVPGASFHRRFAYIKGLVDETKRIPWDFTRRHEVSRSSASLPLRYLTLLL